jgi:uncharacterized protein (TIGR02145 family)
MRKLLLTTAAVAAAIAGAFAAEPSFGTFTDTRDGQTYKTVKIGTQTWMAENLNYQTKSGSWCYKNDKFNCDKYGRLYDWKTAKTVCPNGWKLSSREDWDKLVATAGGKEMAGKKLKSKSGWNDYKGKSGNGTDDYGFSALPGGTRYYSYGNFDYAGYRGGWWTATEIDSGKAYSRGMKYDDYVKEYEGYKSGGGSVRCVEE